MAAKWLIAIPAFASAVLWNYCGLICTKPELGEPTTLAHLAGIAAFFVLLLSGGVGVWIATLEKPRPRRSLTFVVGATAALLLGPGLALSHAPAAIISFEHGVVEGAIVAMLGVSLMVLALLRETITVAQSDASFSAGGRGPAHAHDDED